MKKGLKKGMSKRIVSLLSCFLLASVSLAPVVSADETSSTSFGTSNSLKITGVTINLFDPLGIAAHLTDPHGIAFDSNGNLYMAASGNHKIFKVDGNGVLSTIAGTGVPGHLVDSGKAIYTNIDNPSAVVLDKNGNVYFSDCNNNRVRKIDKNGYVSTVAGNLLPGYSGDGKAANKAQLRKPAGLAFDSNGNLYIADSGNNCVRKVDANGIITTVAGTGLFGFSGDGKAANKAQLFAPQAVAVDNSGNLFISDSLNNRIRKVDANGIITTVAGSTAGYADAQIGTAGKLANPIGLAFDSTGNLFIADNLNNCIRKLDTNGSLTTLYGRDGNLFTPWAVTFDSNGNLYFTDIITNTVKKIVGAQASDKDAVNTAKLLLPSNITLNGDTNLINYIKNIKGIAETGVTIQISSSKNANIALDGTVSYTNAQVTGDVVIKITKGTASDTKTTSATTAAGIVHNGGTAQRIYGQTRIDTALEIAKQAFTSKVSNVVLATAENYPDALTGSVLAKKLNAPILLVGTSQEDLNKVYDYMKNNMNAGGTAYILGQTGAISSDVETSIKNFGFSTKRLGGSDRYETSVKIAQEIGVTNTSIFLATGLNFADALSVSSPAAVNQNPILLVRQDSIPDSVKGEIAAINPSKVYIAGGEAAIGSAVAGQLTQSVERLGGTTRYDTSLLIAQKFSSTSDSVCVATGKNFPDALAGSIYAAKLTKPAPILLTDDTLSSDAVTSLTAQKITGAVIFGGTLAVSETVETQLNNILQGK